MNDKNLKPFTKGDPRAVEAGKKSRRGPSVKALLAKALDQKIDSSPEQWKALAETLGLKGDITKLDVFIEQLTIRMSENDQSLKLGLELAEELRPGDTSQPNAIIYLDKDEARL